MIAIFQSTNNPDEYQFIDLSILIVVAIISLICYFIYCFIFILHLRKSFLRKEFFSLVFGMSTFNLFLNFFVFLNSFIEITNKSLNDNHTIKIIFSSIFNFCFMGNMIYNISIIVYLYKKSTKNEVLIEQDIARDKFEGSSVKFLENHAFTEFHILAIFLGACYSTIILCFNKSGKFLWGLLSVNLPAVYNEDLIDILMFIPHLVYFILSIPYLIISWNKDRISDYIRLKSFALNSFVTSLYSLFFPISFIFVFLSLNKVYMIMIIIKVVSALFFIGLLIKNTQFHLSRYYIQDVLQKDGNSCCLKLNRALKIMFTLEYISDLDLVDYNSMFIYQSLSTMNDFVIDLKSENLGEIFNTLEYNEEEKSMNEKIIGDY